MYVVTLLGALVNITPFLWPFEFVALVRSTLTSSLNKCPLRPCSVRPGSRHRGPRVHSSVPTLEELAVGRSGVLTNYSGPL